ncbi:pyridoxamine 5'-phosphate oxidase family protein [Flavihumibacter stibioxidans]|uniref:Pyridoxamine 5'-phosphate oxidase putative domain-containing protein n=1 Tax=Flavihumibacter stibioxidans TaxID=1834163 RepID=A0ABR7MC56_9BACT|nr:pyridoxamine 5'-phosphate oxidase family protein [Flavihumibacter stibioxidans]MBC6492600.1 hypothetical protein [Flavihumibacter stibioxidans]
MKEIITAFLEAQTCATVCCISENSTPYCFNCYYAFNAADGLLYFKSSRDTEHGKILEINPLVAGTILPDKLVKMTTRGIQFTGKLQHGDALQVKDSANHYYRKFPLAHAIPGEVYTIQLDTIKMTDSTIGFGKKILWARGQTIPTN